MLAVPTCTGLYHTGCTYSTSGRSIGGRNAFAGPGYWNVDFVAAKTFKLTERFSMQFRGELYNVFNHHNFYIQSGNLDIEGGLTAIQAVKGSPSVGAFNGTLPDERRNIQFGLKLIF